MMNPRRVIIQFEIETDLPISALRNADVRVHVADSVWKPTERPRVNVIRPNIKPNRSRKP